MLTAYCVGKWESERVGERQCSSAVVACGGDRPVAPTVAHATVSLSHALAILFAVTLALSHSPTALLAQQESPAQWLARIFEPSQLGIQQYPDATVNRKLSMDAIQLERGGTKRIGIFLIAPDQLDRAAEFFQKQFEIPPQVTGEKTQYVAYTFDFTSGDKGPAKLKGLKVTITRSPFVDNKGQITMEYTPAASK